MSRTRAPRLLGALAALALLFALPAAADEHPEFVEEQVFFECGDENKVRTVNALMGEFDTWTTDAPEESVQAGAGCGTTAGPFADPELSGTWEGTFTGNLEAITAEIHVIDVGPLSREGGDFALFGDLTVGDVTYDLNFGDFFEAETIRSETMASVELRFTITGLPYDDEVGPGEIERDVRLRVNGTPVDMGAFVWGTTEVPSGLTFNPESNERVTVPATPAS